MDISASFKHLGEQIRSARSAAGLTQSELSRLSGVGLNTISLVERANRDVRISTVLQLAAALNCVVEFKPDGRSAREQHGDESGEGYDLDA